MKNALLNISRVVNSVLGLLPGNGNKTKSGILFLLLSVLARLFPDVLPEGFSEEHVQQVADLLVQLFELLGISLTSVGLTHKATKAVEKKLDPTARQW